MTLGINFILSNAMTEEVKSKSGTARVGQLLGWKHQYELRERRHSELKKVIKTKLLAITQLVTELERELIEEKTLFEELKSGEPIILLYGGYGLSHSVEAIPGLKFVCKSPRKGTKSSSSEDEDDEGSDDVEETAEKKLVVEYYQERCSLTVMCRGRMSGPIRPAEVTPHQFEKELFLELDKEPRWFYPKKISSYIPVDVWLEKNSDFARLKKEYHEGMKDYSWSYTKKEIAMRFTVLRAKLPTVK